ncbi:tyrosine-protein kinase receptor Tie-1-like [Glandiceps talaboti]
MAPESLRDSVHTTRSDVWSYGIVLWEIITLGSTPYISMTTKEVVNKILRGFRMPKPRHCNNCIYEVMLKCWQAASDERPTFSELCTKIGEIANDREKEYLAMREFEHHIYVNLTESQWPSGEKI